jgi:hypothetical protein
LIGDRIKEGWLLRGYHWRVIIGRDQTWGRSFMEISSEDREILERLEEELWSEQTRFDTQRIGETHLT